jgi:hypothetical protein
MRRSTMKVAAGLGWLLSASSEGCVNERSRGIGLSPDSSVEDASNDSWANNAELFTGLLRGILQF